MRTADLLDRLLRLARPTAGVLPHEVCLEAGLTQDQVEWMVETGRWQRPFPRSYCTFSGPIPILTRQFAALSYAGRGAMLSHDSAGVTYRMCPPPTWIELSIPYPRQVDDQPDLRVHRSRNLRPSDAHPIFTPHRTRVERTVTDLLPRATTAEAALGLVSDAMRTKQTDADRLRLWLASFPSNARGRSCSTPCRMPRHSVLELLDARTRRRHGLPLGKRQFQRSAAGIEFLDVLDEKYRIHSESDGQLGHDRAVESWRDMRRDNRSEDGRYRHLRYGWADYFDNDCGVAAQLGVVYRQQGWLEPFRRCRKCPAALPASLL